MSGTAQPKAIRRWLVRVAVFLVLATLTWGLMLTFLQRMVLFPRHLCEPLSNPTAAVDGAEVWTIDTPDGAVEAFFLPGAGVSAEKPGPLVLFAHGNGELIDYWPHDVQPYRALGVSVLLPEYRGYGRSAGSPSQDAITEDFVRFVEMAKDRPEVDEARVIYHGRSLGGGAVCALAGRRPPRALVLESSFMSVTVMARSFLMPAFLVRDPFDNLAFVEGYEGPLLVMHGRQDTVIPFRHGEALAGAGANSSFVPMECGHNDCTRGRAYWGHVSAFLSGAGLLTGESGEASR